MNEFQQKMLNKIIAGQNLTKFELKELTQVYSIRETSKHETPICINKNSIVQLGNKHFAIDWYLVPTSFGFGIYECRFLHQPYEVKPVEKNNTVEYWVKI